MNKLLIGLALIGVIGFGSLALLQKATPAKTIASAASTGSTESTKPWIEVVAPRVTEIASGKEVRELHTGDEITAGTTIAVDAKGSASLHFPNGSVTRVDKNTTFTVTQASYEPATDSIQVRLSISVGRLWSKVISLVTSNSSWEVETNNTVVTVRGTAFSVEYQKSGKSTVVGSEGKVATKKKLAAAAGATSTNEVLVTADTFVSIEDKKTAPLVAQKVTADITKDQWVAGNKGEDKKVEAVFDAIRSTQPDESKARAQFRLQMEEQHKAAVAQKEAIQQQPEIQKPTVQTKLEIKTPIKTEVQLQTKIAPTTSIVKTEAASIVSLAIEPVAGDTATEDQTLSFKVFAISKTGVRKDVTAGAQWKVIGPIGSITRPGVLTAKLGADVTEVGTGKGFVVATFKNPETGELMAAQSTVITVNASGSDVGPAI